MYRTRILSSALTALLLGMTVDTADAGAPAADPIACGAFYTVARGDTLFKIADRAYGDGWQYKALHAANSDLLPTAESLEIGYELLIPCRDGRGPATRAEALAASPAIPAAGPEVAVPEADATTDALLRHAAALARSVAEDRSRTDAGDTAEAFLLPSGHGETDVTSQHDGSPSIRMLAGVGLAPAAGFQAGRVTSDLIRRAVALAAPDADVQIDTAPANKIAQGAFLPGGAFDVSFPWLMPDCGSASPISGETARLCADYSFSRPLLEATVGFYVRAGDALAIAPAATALAGRHVCRPEGHVTLDPAQPGQTGSAPALVTLPSAADCFDRLLAGEVDLVSLLSDDAESAIAALGIAGAVAEAVELRDTRTVHAVARKGDLRGEAALAAIDRGIERLMLSGGWFDLVAAHRRRDRAVR